MGFDNLIMCYMCVSECTPKTPAIFHGLKYPTVWEINKPKFVLNSIFSQNFEEHFYEFFFGKGGV